MATDPKTIPCKFYYGGLGVCYKGNRCPFSHGKCFPHRPEDNRGVVGEKVLEELRGNVDAWREMKNSLLDFKKNAISGKEFIKQADALGMRHMVPEIATTLIFKHRSKYNEIVDALKKTNEEDDATTVQKDVKNIPETKFVEKGKQNNSEQEKPRLSRRVQKPTQFPLKRDAKGLVNTSYVKSTLQCLKSVPELESALSVLVQDEILMKQDGEAGWTKLLHALSESLKSPSLSADSDPVKSLFKVDLRSRMYCYESAQESSKTESVYSLKCHVSDEVNHLHEGLEHGLNREFENMSTVLGETLIDSLPRYLTVQLMRFFWNKKTNQEEKILTKVDFPFKLDIFDHCSEFLQKKIEVARQADLGDSHETGIYHLVSVLTHKGKSSDSGFYMSWVVEEDQWFRFDGDQPTVRGENDILELAGGGYSHIAFILVYKT